LAKSLKEKIKLDIIFTSNFSRPRISVGSFENFLKNG